VIRLALLEQGTPFAVVQPSPLKAYATGKGNALKEAVLSAAVKRSGIEFRTSDESDAWWLRQMGLARFERAAAVPRARTARHWREWIGQSWDEVSGCALSWLELRAPPEARETWSRLPL
jgi:hypothetical protein